jgi:hypothetical protein
MFHWCFFSKGRPVRRYSITNRTTTPQASPVAVEYEYGPSLTQDTEREDTETKRQKRLQYQREYYEKRKDSIRQKQETPENREKRLQYHREYYQKNRDGLQNNREELLQYYRTYYKKNQDKIRQRMRHYNHANYIKNRDARLQYSQRNREKILQYSRAYYKKNRDAMLQKMRQNSSTYYEKSRDKRLLYAREYFQKNREKRQLYFRESRCRKLKARGLPPPKKNSSWKSTDEVRNFLQSFSDLHFLKRWPEDWYRISNKQIELAGGMP